MCNRQGELNDYDHGEFGRGETSTAVSASDARTDAYTFASSSLIDVLRMIEHGDAGQYVASHAGGNRSRSLEQAPIQIKLNNCIQLMIRS